jgi:hypothetical protein
MAKQQLFVVDRAPTVGWGEAGTEPDLCELFADPLLHLVMQRDGVSLPALRQVVATAQLKLRRGLCLAA